MSLDWKFFENRFPLAVSSLKNARSVGRLTHAFLLCSTNGEYREEFPPLLASLAACEHPNPDFSPCGHCRICREMMDGTFPDLFTLAPSSVSRIIPIGENSDEPDTMRWFEALFHLSGMTDCGWKIGIIHEADRLNEAAQNAFLKTLEEPPEKCLFILTTAHPSELLPTIRSRCQSIQLTDNVCKYEFPDSDRIPPILHKLLFEAKGSLLAAEDCAVELIDFADSLGKRAEEKVGEKWAKTLENAENLESAGKNLIEKRIKGAVSSEYRRTRDLFLSMIHAYFAQISFLLSGMPAEYLPNPELLSEPFKTDDLKKVDEKRIQRCLGYAEDLLRAMRTNADDQLAIRAFCLKTVLK